MSITKKFIFIIFLITFSNQIFAEEVKKMGTHKDWETYIIKNESNKVCFTQSKPVLQAPKTSSREARLFISFRTKGLLDFSGASPGKSPSSSAWNLKRPSKQLGVSRPYGLVRGSWGRRCAEP